MKVKDVMHSGVTWPIFYCRSDGDIEDAIRIMEKNKVRRLPAIDEKKRMVGMLSLGDISQKVPQALAGEAIQAVSGHRA